MTPPRTPRTAFALVVALALVTSSCASSDDAEKKAGGPTVGAFAPGLVNVPEDAEAVDGGTITLGSYAEPLELDPVKTIVAGTTGGTEMAAVYDVLMRWDEEEQAVVPQLAESLTPNEDHTTWELTLRPDVTFSDGTTLGAEAVRWSIDRYLEQGGHDAAVWSHNVTDMQVTGDLTLELTLERPWPSFDSLFTTGIGMVVAKGSDAGEQFRPIGAGPFVFEDRTPQERMTFTTNPDYFDGKPALDTLEFVYIVDPNALWDTFGQGDVSMAIMRDPILVEEALSEETPGYLQMVGAGVTGLINSKEGYPGSDVRVRQAIQMAVDPELVNERANGGAGVVSSSLFPETSRFHQDGVEGLPHDPEEARKLVQAAKADGFDGKITYLQGSSPQQRDIGLAVKAQLDAVGFEAEAEFLPSITDLITRVVVDGDYDMSTWALSWRDSAPYARMFGINHSEGGTGYGTVSSPEMDQLIEDFQAAATDEAQLAAAEALQTGWNELVPAMVLGPTAELVVWQPEVGGVQTNSNTMVLLDDAWAS
ncbi:ABC transporter substrate-binding protein [Nocardioides piscis]|uniref:ABC transporter substrate-binding protein n=1 Tax=Nocardioides piscis TaxID=2714938 RepID=A0A6G7YH87_9ACTN|nr:ABC transporter substrate-binding protein [Nocardioides piscis]QIK76163.1 ABC transporter substrate-binding protein [Nocardioides piscis]